MISSSCIRQLVLATSVITFSLTSVLATAQAQSSSVRFQRPGSSNAQSERVSKGFRRPGLTQEEQAPTAAEATPQASPSKKRPAKKRPVVKQARVTKPVATKVAKQTRKVRTVKKTQPVRREAQVVAASSRQAQYGTDLSTEINLTSYGCGICDGPCMCDASCGCPEPSCGLYEPGCGICEPSCGCGEPSCGICEPGCGIAEPSCGCGDVGCGSCCALPGPDYWCFPVCLPRFKDLSFFAGVQGFRGPRDFTNQRSDSNFGFNEGFNLSGRAPFVSLLFPQLSYQLGYRAVQSRIHGTATSADDRSQQFVTAGLFRRAKTGLQYGLVWDLLEDDLDEDVDLHQIRYEVSLKSPLGREIGFFGTSSSNDAMSNGILWETTDQYAGFFRWTFGNGYESRLWGGATGDGEGIFGGDFYAPMSSRWALQSGFNYQGTSEPEGLAGVSQESWNVGINMVWHLGKTAKRGCHSPYRPMFSVADNGWMLVDRAQ